ncbi:MAG: MFS transporter [Frankiales bacterium]|nr:MFS transporter [Frankiales bacterium]
MTDQDARVSEPVHTRPRPVVEDQGLFGPRYRSMTLGVVLVMTMFAFEGVGVATAMPVVARALDGLGAYAWAFNGYVVSSLVAMVVAGEWCDRAGPRAPLLLGVSLFGAGALLAGAAWSMPVLVLARVVQGLGGGLSIVTVYVVMGRAFPDSLRPRAFALLSAAWVLPAIVGPLVSGFLTDYVSWRAVFWLVVPFVLPPILLLAPRLARLGGALTDGPRRRGRVRLSLVAAAGLALLQEGGTRRGPAGVVMAAVGVVLLLPALRRLLPAGSLRFARGLPTVVVMRGILAGAFFASEAFVPLALRTVRGVSTTQSGLTLTIGAVAWAVGSQLQGRLYGRVPRHLLVQTGAGLVALCMATLPLSLDPSVPFWVAAFSWFAGAVGMGLCFGAIGTLTLELSPPEDQGANVAALQVCDSVGSVLLVGLAGAIYGTAFAAGPVGAATFVTIWLVMAVVAALAVVAGGRIRQPA